MNKDRGMIKWMPFNSLINSKEVVKSLIHEKSKITKPIISEEESKNIEELIIEAFYMQSPVLISYYQNGYIYKIKSYIKKIDQIQNLIYLNATKILFQQIISVKLAL